jgi:hypothetical protein
MMLDIADALPLILEGTNRRTNLQIAATHAILFAVGSLWPGRDGYAERKSANRLAAPVDIT